MPTRIIITRVTDPGDIADQLVAPMTNLGNAIATRMQRLVPKRTWALHDTIGTETRKAGSKVITDVGAGGGDVDYEMYVERGTSRQKAQPYMRPALLQSKASDLNFGGGGPKRHGVVRVETRRTRAAQRRASSRAAGASEGAES